MKKVILYILSCLNKNPKVLSVEEAVKFSIDKYQKTYKLLEKNEEVGPKTHFLADDEGIRNYFQ